MSFHYRIRTVYAKELVDILRDRRTLIAMVVVPIVLYPLLMVGSIQAISIQTKTVSQDVVVVAVLGEAQEQNLRRLADEEARILKSQRRQTESGSPENQATPLRDQLHVLIVQSVEEMDENVRSRIAHIGVVFAQDSLVDRADFQNEIQLRPDLEDVRGFAAHQRITEMIRRVDNATVTQRKADAGLDPFFDRPFKIVTTDLSSPPSVLGQILPLILILMTITGAIYPAIDLTAGERERGTLESLMVSPVPVIDLIVGKFLVVTTVAIMGAALNLASVSATVYFGGFSRIIAAEGRGLPIWTMIQILLFLIPFAILMSAIMIAVCSYARTFKEAQNYVTPVILAVLIPGGIAALPASRLEGIMCVMPVGNMVLLAKELLLGADVPVWNSTLVLASTTLYASAAVAVAANIFGRETVVFADAASLKSSFTRRLIRPTARPKVSMALLVVSLMFPLWFFIQASLSPQYPDQSALDLILGSGRLMPVVFVLLPLLILVYWKINVVETFALRTPSGRHMLAAVLIGLTALVPAHEISVLQSRLIEYPAEFLRSAQMMQETLADMPLSYALLVIAIVPAICEELLFRGFLLSALRTSWGKWGALMAVAAVFAVFHFVLLKFWITFGMGLLLGYLCWQSRSIVPGILAHMLHNALSTLVAIRPEVQNWLGLSESSDTGHFPGKIIIGGSVIFVAGVFLARRVTDPPTPLTHPPP